MFLHIKKIEKPTVKDHEVLIKVEAVSVNRADTLQRRGQYPPPSGVSPVLGLECAGHVACVGDQVRHAAVGDRVMALLPGGGGYAQYVAVYHEHVMRVPNVLDMEQAAAAIPEVWLTDSSPAASYNSWFASRSNCSRSRWWQRCWYSSSSTSQLSGCLCICNSRIRQ